MSSSGTGLIPYRYRPTLGFLLVCAVYTGCVLFLAWGASPPDLDRVWFLEKELRTGVRTELSEGDLAAIFRSLERHPELSRGLLEGRDLGLLSVPDQGYLESDLAYILRAPGTASRQLSLSCQGPAAAYPLQITLRLLDAEGQHALEDLTITASGSRLVTLPPTPTPQIVEIRCAHPARQPDAVHSVLTEASIRVTFPSSP
jgi:hypothetical protein